MLSAAALIGLALLNSARQAPAVHPTVTPVQSGRPGSGGGEPAHRLSVAEVTEAKIEGMLRFPGHEVRIVLASVADPDRTSLRLNTDRTIDALLLAAFQEGYVLDDHWIPWRFSLEQMDQDYADRRKEKDAIEQQSKFPGVLVLEHKRSVLIYLLIPEGPTSGVNREVLSKAVGYVKRFDQDGKAPFVGPSFTAGMESLEEWVHDSPTDAHAISRIVSGTVTGSSPGLKKVGHAPFQVVRTPRVEGERMTRDFLCEMRGGRHSMIRLAEDSTRFGMGAAGAATVKCNGETHREATLSFPWQISRVRNAAPELISMPNDRGDYRLQLQMKESRRPEGSLPTFAGTQTPAVQEVVLTQIAARLERERADYVSIVATDVLDALFLSQLLHAANPGQRVMTNQADLIYLRAQEGLSRNGLLATSSFPLSNHLRLKRTSKKTDDREPRNIVFDSELSAGIFTAALYAVRHQTQEANQGWSFQLPMDGAAPRPYWLLALGSNGFWPIARLDSRADSAEVQHDPFGISWVFLFCLSLAAIVVWFLMACASRFGRVSGLEDIHVEISERGWHREATSLTLVTSTAGLAYVVASAPIWWTHFRQPHVDRNWIACFWIGLLLITAAGIVPWLHRGGGKWQAVLLPIASLPLLLVVGVNFAGPKQDDYMLLRFFLLRSQDYLNGIAPLLPVVILLLGFAGYWWSIHIGTVLTQERYISIGALNAPKFCRSTLSPSTLGVCAIAAIPVGTVTWHSLHSLEPLSYDRCYIGLLYLLLVATLYGCARFVLLWRNIRSFLDRLELHPINTALEQVRKEDEGDGEQAPVPVWESHPRRRSSWFYLRALKKLRQLRAAEGASGRLDSVIRKLENYLSLSGQEQEEAKGGVEGPLSRLGAEFEQELEAPEGAWTDQHAPSAIDDLKQQFLAYRFGAFLRCCFLHMRNRITAMTAGFVAITLSLNSYAFGPERMIQAFTIGLVLLMGACVISVFVQMHRHPMLIMLSGSKGKMDWGLWAKIGSAAAIPLLTLFASYTPTFSKFIGKWLQPALEAATK